MNKRRRYYHHHGWSSLALRGKPKMKLFLDGRIFTWFGGFYITCFKVLYHVSYQNYVHVLKYLIFEIITSIRAPNVHYYKISGVRNMPPFVKSTNCYVYQIFLAQSLVASSDCRIMAKNWIAKQERAHPTSKC